MAKMTEIRWHARAGQGAVTAGKMLADMALDAGLYFQAFPDYGAEREGAPIKAYTRLCQEPIYVHSQIKEPDVILVLDPTLLDVVDVTDGLKDGGTVLVNSPLPPQEIREKLKLKGGKVCTVDATRIAMDTLGRDITNTPMLGALVQVTGVASSDALIDQVRERFGKKFKREIVDANVEAIKRAVAEVREG